MSRLHKSSKNPLDCSACGKLSWRGLEAATRKVERLKEAGNIRKPYLFDVSQCPEGRGWHIGHTYKLQFISPCIGEHK